MGVRLIAIEPTQTPSEATGTAFELRLMAFELRPTAIPRDVIALDPGGPAIELMVTAFEVRRPAFEVGCITRDRAGVPSGMGRTATGGGAIWNLH